MRKFKRQRGYITIVQQSEGIDYLRMAYALALSLRATQSSVSHLAVAVLPGTKVPKKYANVFDEVVEIPWGDDAAREKWKIQNKWKVYHITPYEETVLLDCDMLFPMDVSHWWNVMAHRKMWTTTTPRDFRGNPILNSKYRAVFEKNQLPNVYSAFMYFKQDEEVHEVFDYARRQVYFWSEMRDYYQYRQLSDEDIIAYSKNPRFRYHWNHHYKTIPHKVSGDLMFAYAMKALGREEWAPSVSLPTFTHMKAGDQKVNSDDDWKAVLSLTMKRDLTLVIDNYVQRYPVHYHLKDFLNDGIIIRKLEEA